jgi:hypothetical protein
MVTEASILSMLGQDSRKYHSCVATTFSFDFAFFEMSAMRALKAAGVRNTLVLVDERMLTELFEHPSGLEFKVNSGYGLYPMTSRGAFHPKMILCVGRKEGLLAVGSGNLTSSGHGHGSELWSVFHFDRADGPTAGVFAQAWAYMRELTEGLNGNSKEKLEWMKLNAPWLSELPSVPQESFVSLVEASIALRGIAPSDDGLSVMLRDLQGVQVKSITVISPFYDTDGAFLLALSAAFPSITIDVVLETEFGLPPHRLEGGNCRFHDWRCARPEEDVHKRRLHAKLLLFTMADGSEYAIMGSSNATVPGFGTSSERAKNHELNCHIKWSKGGLLQRLGIRLSAKSVIDLGDIPVRQGDLVGQGVETAQRRLLITSAEHIGPLLHVFSEGSFTGTVSLQLFDGHGQALGQIPKLEFKSELQCQLPENIKGIRFIALHDEHGQPLSGRQILQNSFYHLQGNPDRRMEELNNLFNGIESGHFSRVEDLLRYVSFDDEASEPRVAGHQADSVAKPQPDAVGRTLDSYEQFTEVSEAELNRKKGLLTSPNVLIAEFLSKLSNRQLAVESVNQDEQDGSLDADMGLSGEGSSAKEKVNASVILREKKAVHGFITKFHRAVVLPSSEKLAAAPSRSKSYYAPTEVTIAQLSSYIITAQLMRRYLRRPYEFESEVGQESGHFIEMGGQDRDWSLSSYTWNVIPHFLLQLRAGVKRYEHETLRKRASEFLLESSYFSLLHVCNSHWQSVDMPWWNVLMANAVLAAHEAARYHTKELWAEFSSWLTQTSSSEEFMSSQRTEHLKYLRKTVLPRVVPFLHEWDKQRLPLRSAGDLRGGDCIFVSAFGFCMVSKVSPATAEGGYAVGITNPGFPDVSSHLYSERIEIFKSVFVFDWNQ